ncbi:unnamed protein product [Closterium sp. NIES-65]|nr:unnamed protein product [Closterium sp. NIES-65]
MANPAFQGGPLPHELDVRGMLQLARQRVDEGQPSAALQLVSILCPAGNHHSSPRPSPLAPRDGRAGMLQLARQRVDEGQPTAALQLIIALLREQGGKAAVLATMCFRGASKTESCLPASHPPPNHPQIIAVLRAQGGEAAVLTALTQARAMHHNQQQMQQLQQGADDITALLARCAIGSADVAVPAGTGQMAAGGSAMAWGGGDVGIGGSGMGSNSIGEQRGEGAMNGGMEGVDGYAFHSGYGSTQSARYGMQATAAGYGMDQAGRQGIDPAAYGMESAGRHGVDGEAILAEQGRMQVVTDAAADGSSVTCSICRGVISGARWKEHVQFWCRAAVHDPQGMVEGEEHVQFWCRAAVLCTILRVRSYGCDPMVVFLLDFTRLECEAGIKGHVLEHMEWLPVLGGGQWGAVEGARAVAAVHDPLEDSTSLSP